VLIIVFALGILAYFLYLHHATAERCFKAFQSIWIVFLVLLVLAISRGRSQPGARTAVADSIESRWILFTAIAAAVLAYVGTLHFNFVSDDYTLLMMGRRPFAQAMHEYFFVGQVDSSGAAIFYRPLGFATVNFEYLLWGSSIPAYHLACIALHVVCVTGLFRLCRELALGARVSATAALLFAVLPVNVQAITWATARFDRFAAAAMLLCLVMYLRFRRTGSWATGFFALALMVVAVECKEFAFVLPVLAFAAELALKTNFNRPAVVRVLSFFAVAAAAFVWRMHLIHGIGGYHTASGDPSVLHLGKAFKAAFIRAPGETLFGFNWLHPGGLAFLAETGAIAAIVLYFAFEYRPEAEERRIALFAFALIVLPVAPGHFLFWWSDPGLVFSRALYFSAGGMALLLALLLQRWSQSPRMYYAELGLLVALLIAAQQHNVDAWRFNSKMSGQFLAEVQRVGPLVLPNRTLCVHELPTHVHGVQFFDVNPTAAASYVYGARGNVVVQRAEEGCDARPDAVQVTWDEQLSLLRTASSTDVKH
jgi:succinate dehydrogenase hydrophobic anchor subunit